MNKYKIQLIEWEVHYSAVCAENAKKRDLKKTGNHMFHPHQNFVHADFFELPQILRTHATHTTHSKV